MKEKNGIIKIIGFENILIAMAILAIIIVAAKIIVEPPQKNVFLLVQVCESDIAQLRNCGQLPPLRVPDLNETKLMVSTLGKPLAEIQAIYYLKQGNIILEVKTIANKTDNRYSFASQTLKAGGAITLIGGKQDIKGLILGFSEDYNKIKIEKINATITILSSRIITDKNSFVGIIQKDFSGRKIAEIEEIETKDSKTIAKVKILGFRIKGALFFNGLPLEKGTVLYIVGTNNVLNGIVLDISEREI